MSPSLPASLIAKLSPKCRWRGCQADKADGADYCAPHHEKQKGYQRASDARRRAKLKAQGQCRDCGGDLPKRWNSGRCRRCQREQAEGAKSARLKDTARRLQNTAAVEKRGHYKTEVFADGAERTRYVGQSHRGGPTRAEQDASLVKDWRSGYGRGGQFGEKFPAIRAEIDALSRVQRQEAWERFAYEHLTSPARDWLGVASALGCPVAAAILRALEEAGG